MPRLAGVVSHASPIVDGILQHSYLITNLQVTAEPQDYVKGLTFLVRRRQWGQDSTALRKIASMISNRILVHLIGSATAAAAIISLAVVRRFRSPLARGTRAAAGEQWSRIGGGVDHITLAARLGFDQPTSPCMLSSSSSCHGEQWCLTSLLHAIERSHMRPQPELAPPFIALEK